MSISPRNLLRHIRRRRWDALWAELRYAGAIHGWKNPFAEFPVEAVPVHVLCGAKQWNMAKWMLASWFHTTGRNWTIVLHDDGTLTKRCLREVLSFRIPARCVWRSESDKYVGSMLQQYPHCCEHRARSPHALKFYDPRLYCNSAKYIILDTDMVFFKTPVEILQWVDSDSNDCYFMEDIAEANQIGQSETHALFGVSLWERVNSGICLLWAPAIQLSDAERFLRDAGLLARNLWMVEQTLFALCGSKHGLGGTLPSQYELSFSERMRRSSVMRHYVGAVRYLFYSEGVRGIQPSLLCASESAVGTEAADAHFTRC